MLRKAQYTHSIFIRHLWSHGAAANHLAFHDETAVVTLASFIYNPLSLPSRIDMGSDFSKILEKKRE